MKETTKTKNQNNTELIFILDRSGSMGGLETETINGYNSVVKKQTEECENLKVTTVLFDNQIDKIYDGVSGKDAMLNDKQYFVRGSTALLDAVCVTIKEVENRHKKMTVSKRPKKVIVAITTDGYENSSKEYDYPKTKELIKTKQENGWEFLFMAANIDEKLVGREMGISKNACYKFSSSSEGIERVSCFLSKKLSSMIREDKTKNLNKKGSQ